MSFCEPTTVEFYFYKKNQGFGRENSKCLEKLIMRKFFTLTQPVRSGSNKGNVYIINDISGKKNLG